MRIKRAMHVRFCRLLAPGGIAWLIAAALPVHNAMAQDNGGNNNPTGVSGQFNGNVTTACSYDPYTGNAQRVVDDIIVPGSVGAYPLKWSRIHNTRSGVGWPGEMGIGWSHSYSWHLSRGWGDVAFLPDGRVVGNDTSGGVPEHIDSNGVLYLGDGGRVLFEKLQGHYPNGTSYDVYRVSQIIDPFGQITQISYDTYDYDDYGNALYYLSSIMEPGGRSLVVGHDEIGNISTVQAVDAGGNVTQSVNYTYSVSLGSTSRPRYSALTRADYSDGTFATYTWQDDNSSRGGPGLPILKTADDVRYAGAMRQIEYELAQGDRVHGKITAEKKLGSGEAVSTLTFVDPVTRVETRGDGLSRTFKYASNGHLSSYSDFTGNHWTQLVTDGCGFIGGVTDARNNSTGYSQDCYGNLTQIRHPGDGSHIDFERWPSNPALVSSVRNERGNTTYYDRDGAGRVYQIRYPDGAYETFTYNDFGQVLAHRRRNGAYNHFLYDANGRLFRAWNPTLTASYPPPYAEPHVDFYYYIGTHPWNDRIYAVVDPRGDWTLFDYDVNAAGQPVAGRGLVSKITHWSDNTYQSFGYDQFGARIWAENELRQRTTFSYDDYGRLLSATPPAPAGAISYTYEPTNGAPDPYLHTTGAVHLKTDGAGVVIENKYDENFRPASVTQKDGSTDPTSHFSYDEVGNLILVQGPRGYPTFYGYDSRNRKETQTDTLNQVARWHYDAASNIDQITRPDNQVETMSYDPMNRVTQHVEPVRPGVNKTTTLGYFPSGTVQTITDDNSQATSFEYDPSDLKTKMSYPDGSYQEWSYDQNKNVLSRRSIGGKTQTFSYDGRNRLTNMRWDSGVPDWADFGYDLAGRLTNANNGSASITRRYDDAGRLLTEEQNVYGLGARTVSYGSDGAGKVTAMGLVGTDYQLAYQYDALGRFEQIVNVQNTPNGTSKSLWFQYSYDAASNETQRYCAINGVGQLYDRDELGRLRALTIQKVTASEYEVVNVGPGGLPIQTMPLPGLLAGLTNLISGATGVNVPTVGSVISSEHYGYNALNQLTNIHRDEDGFNDTFSYDYTGQLTSASYGWNGRSVSYTQDNVGNRSQVNDNGSVQGYSSNPNYRNQYTAGPAGAVSNGVEHEIADYQGLSYSYYGDRHLYQVTGGGHNYSVGYDALGRCIWRALDGALTYYVYDGAKPIYEYKADGTRAGWNLYGKGVDEILLRADYVVLSNGQGYFYQQEHLSSVSYLTGFYGEVIESYRYDAFGQPTTTYTGGVFNNRFKFTGREWNDTFGFYEYRARTYHPGLGRFLQSDPIGFAAGDANLFRYCGGDPVNGNDPSGLLDPNSRIKLQNNASVATTNGVTVTGAPVPPAPAAVPFGPSGGITFSGGGFFQGIERTNGDFLDTIPADAANGIVRAPPLGTPHYPPGAFPPGYSPGPISFTLSGGAPSWHPWDEAMDVFRILVTPAAGMVSVFQNGITITENGGIGEGVQQQLTLNSAGVTYRLGFGPGVGGGLSVTSAIVQSGQVTGPNVQASVSGGYFFGGALSGTIGTGPTAYRAGPGFGIGFGATVTYGQTVFVPWPWKD
ncbi:MAG: hypothetical protein QOF24_1272 [Verrucomicrobiota bacterium]|jgi:RHS repeat-associated protein